MSPDNPLLCHIQISKAATNSFRRILTDNVQKDALEIFKHKQRSLDGSGVTIDSKVAEVCDFISRIVERQNQLQAVSMMLPVGLHRILSRQVCYVGLIRSPVARSLSALNFVYARRDTHPAAPDFQSHEYSLAKLIDAGEIDFINDQVRMLAGVGAVEITQEHLDQAKENIETRFVDLGVAENPSQCWNTLVEIFNWRVDSSMVLNKGTYEGSLVVTPHDLSRFREANRFDQSLYTWVTEEYLPRRQRVPKNARIQ